MRNQRGATILETFLVFLILSIIFIGMFQIYMLVIANMVTNYAAYYAAKSWALGYNVGTTRRAARVAAMSISGKDISRQPLSLDGNVQREAEYRARDYMMFDRGGTFGVNYAYWRDQNVNFDDRDKGAMIYIGHSTGTEKVKGRVELQELQVNWLTKQLDFSVGNTVDMINYSSNYLVSDGYRRRVDD